MAFRQQQNATELMDDAAAAHLGINRTDARALDILDQRGPITAGELATAMGLTTGAVTTVLDRMEQKGYARRVRDAVDRRKVVVEITEDAKRRSWDLYGPLAKQAFDELSRLPDEELEFLRDFIVRGTEFLIKHAAWVRGQTGND